MAISDSVSRYRWVVLGLAFTGQMNNALASLAVAPLAPLFQPELGLTKAEVGFFSSAAYAGAWGILLVAGSMTDRVGVRTMMSAGQVATGLLMLAMGSVVSFAQAAAVMFAAGMGRGAVAPGVTKAILDWFPPKGRATAMGLKQAGVPVAGVLTASTLPAIGLVLGWRTAIALVGLLIVAGGALTASLYREAPNLPHTVARGYSPRSGLGEVLRNRALWVLSAVAVLFVTTQLALISYLALYLNDVVLPAAVPDEAARIVAAGGYLALCQTGGVFGRIFWSVVSDRLFQGRRLVVLSIIGSLAAVISVVVGYLAPGCPLWVLAAIVFAYGATAVGWNGLYQALIVETAGRRNAGTGVGLSMTLSQFGTVGGPLLFGFVVDTSGTYQTAWLLLACLSATGTLVSVLGARRETHYA